VSIIVQRNPEPTKDGDAAEPVRGVRSLTRRLQQGSARERGKHEEFLFALADAVHEEYRAVVAAGFVLQIDDPGLPDWWDMLKPEPTVESYRRFARLRIDAVNRALAGIPEDRVRYHLCWGSWHGPHTHDLPLEKLGVSLGHRKRLLRAAMTALSPNTWAMGCWPISAIRGRMRTTPSGRCGPGWK
jgi:hypothetical protein